MKDKTIRTIINFCTNDYRYLDLCIQAVKDFSEEITIPVCDHFFNGEKENRALLEYCYEKYPDCNFVEYAYPDKVPYGKNPQITIDDPNYKHYLHSTSRYLGFLHSKKQTEFTLFIDVDEIIDTNRFIKWWKDLEDHSFQALRFFSYMYFREERYRCSSGNLINALLIRNRCLIDPEILLTITERKGVYDHLELGNHPYIMGIDGEPLVHHYSWVRTKKELEKKASSWGHAHENNWLERIEEEFSQSDFRMLDYVFFHRYEEVSPLHFPMLAEIPNLSDTHREGKKNLANVIYLGANS